MQTQVCYNPLLRQQNLVDDVDHAVRAGDVNLGNFGFVDQDLAVLDGDFDFATFNSLSRL